MYLQVTLTRSDVYTCRHTHSQCQIVSTTWTHVGAQIRLWPQRRARTYKSTDVNNGYTMSVEDYLLVAGSCWGTFTLHLGLGIQNYEKQTLWGVMRTPITLIVCFAWLNYSSVISILNRNIHDVTFLPRDAIVLISLQINSGLLILESNTSIWTLDVPVYEHTETVLQLQQENAGNFCWKLVVPTKLQRTKTVFFARSNEKLDYLIRVPSISAALRCG